MEIEKLIAFAGGRNVAGKALKEAGSSHWGADNTGTDEFLFTALPAGVRFDTWPSYNSIGVDGGFWSNTVTAPETASVYIFDAFVDDAIKESKKFGFGEPVRCLKD